MGVITMGRLRGWILFGLIAYFGGFATAIYYLAPVSQEPDGRRERQTVQSGTWKNLETAQIDREKIQEIAGQFGQRMREVVSLAEEKVQQAVSLYRAQTAAAKQDKES